MKAACLTASECDNAHMNKGKSQKSEAKQGDSQQASATPEKGRKIGYVRVSDADQSEDLQIDALTKAGCTKLYTDHGLSGIKRHRPGLRAMLDDLTSGDTLTVWKLDRLGRSTLHLMSILEDLQARGIHFHAITQGIDTSTAVGRMIFGQLAVFAEYERALISERTKAGMKAAKARGVHVGRPKMSAMTTNVLEELAQVEEIQGMTDEQVHDLIKEGRLAVDPRTVSKVEH